MCEKSLGLWIIIYLQKLTKSSIPKENNMRKKKSKKLEPLEEIKRLIILGLANQGVKGKDIAAMLEVDPAIISRMLSPKKK